MLLASCPQTQECSASASVPKQMEQIEDISSRSSSADDESAGTSDTVRNQTVSNFVECSDDVDSEVNGNDPGNEPGLSTLNGKVCRHQKISLHYFISLDILMVVQNHIAVFISAYAKS